MCKSIETFKEHMFNNTCEGTWKKEDEIDYGYSAMPICDNSSAISAFSSEKAILLVESTS